LRFPKMKKDLVLRQAGGVVVSGRDVLMVSSQRDFHRWLFPKGDIEPGETPQDCARREVLEEAGVRTEVAGFLCSVSYRDRARTVRLRLYLMRYLGESGESRERRARRWVPIEESARRHHLGSVMEPAVRAAMALLRRL
jgi:8-oxo-dGTP pyrophosphatase MutT (NUDIX family)